MQAEEPYCLHLCWLCMRYVPRYPDAIAIVGKYRLDVFILMTCIHHGSRYKMSYCLAKQRKIFTNCLPKYSIQNMRN